MWKTMTGQEWSPQEVQIKNRSLTGRSLSKCLQHHPKEGAPLQAGRNDVGHLVDQYTLKWKGVYQDIMSLLFSRSVMPDSLRPRGP